MSRTKEQIVEEINSIVEKNIQPSVEMHGGVVKLQDFDMDTGVALMLMSGACSGCASSSVTLKLGVENMLKHYIPEVNAVEGVDDPIKNYNSFVIVKISHVEKHPNADKLKVCKVNNGKESLDIV